MPLLIKILRMGYSVDWKRGIFTVYMCGVVNFVYHVCCCANVAFHIYIKKRCAVIIQRTRGIAGNGLYIFFSRFIVFM